MSDTGIHPPIDTAVIFAGGKSSRMGTDKALLPFGGCDSMAAYQYQKLSKIFNHVYLSAKEQKFDQRHFGAAAPIIYDRYPQSSPMVALASLFETLQEEAIFILSVDMPLLTPKAIQRLCNLYQKADPVPTALVAKTPRGIEPLCGIYHRSALPHIQRLLQEDIHRIRALLAQVETAIIHYDESDIFANLNTPQEYQNATRPQRY